jgi:hypothetical protein
MLRQKEADDLAESLQRMPPSLLNSPGRTEPPDAAHSLPSTLADLTRSARGGDGSGLMPERHQEWRVLPPATAIVLRHCRRRSEIRRRAAFACCV